MHWSPSSIFLIPHTELISGGGLPYGSGVEIYLCILGMWVSYLLLSLSSTDLKIGAKESSYLKSDYHYTQQDHWWPTGKSTDQNVQHYLPSFSIAPNILHLYSLNKHTTISTTRFLTFFTLPSTLPKGSSSQVKGRWSCIWIPLALSLKEDVPLN